MAGTATILWFRNDLRLADLPALQAAAAGDTPIVPLFILEEGKTARALGGAAAWWLQGSLQSLGRDIERRGGHLILRHGDPAEILPRLVTEFGAGAIHASRTYEPGARRTEAAVQAALQETGAALHLHTGTLLFEPDAVLTAQAKPYRVFTPFWKACLASGVAQRPAPAPSRLRFAKLPAGLTRSESLAELRLQPSRRDWAADMRASWHPGEAIAKARLAHFIEDRLGGYAENRDRLDIDGSSQLSPYLRFGEISPLQCWHAVSQASAESTALQQGAESFLRELGWREFAYHLLWHFPEIVDRPLKPQFADFPWRHAPDELRAWQRGETGYPVIDAAMRQLWQTGWLPNRARMIVASFLVKHLLIDWRSGAEWFLDTLVDADLANNQAGWQWVAGSGTDAAPYFRIFNPVLQAKRFDRSGDYIRRFVPELARLDTPDIHSPWETLQAALDAAGVVLGQTYPYPLIDHDKARARALSALQASHKKHR